MNKFLHIGICLILVSWLLVFASNDADAATINVAPRNFGLVGYWSFDGKNMGTTSSRDLTNNGNTGWLINGPLRAAGKLGQALSFDGSNDYVSVSDNTALEPAIPFSVSVWAKFTTTANTVVLEKDGNNGYSVQTLSSGLIMASGGAGAGNRITTSVTTNNNQWHHAVFVVTGSNNGDGKAYIDGVDRTSEADPSAPLYSTGALVIGSRSGTVAFPGLIDEVRVYNRALSDKEVRTLYNMGR